jgi:hypothetical protein
MTHLIETMRTVRVNRANHAWVHRELTDSGLSTKTADELCKAWESEAKRIGLDRRVLDFWTLGSAWIQVRRRTRP